LNRGVLRAGDPCFRSRSVAQTVVFAQGLDLESRCGSELILAGSGRPTCPIYRLRYVSVCSMSISLTAFPLAGSSLMCQNRPLGTGVASGQYKSDLQLHTRSD